MVWTWPGKECAREKWDAHPGREGEVTKEPQRVMRLGVVEVAVAAAVAAAAAVATLEVVVEFAVCETGGWEENPRPKLELCEALWLSRFVQT